MNAWQVKPGDGVAGLQRIDATRRAVGPTDVVVKIHSAGLNYRDLMFARGDYLGIGTDALIPVADGAGEVIETGRDVTRFKPGDRVINTYFPHWIDGPPTPQKVSGSPGAQFDGVLAEHFVSDEAALVAIPAHLNYDEAATLSCAGTTAWNALFADGGLEPGATVVLLGTGGVSIIALQLAHDERAIDLLRLDVAHYRMLYRAALDALTLMATASERAEQIGRELRKEREAMMAQAFAAPDVRTEAQR